MTFRLKSLIFVAASVVAWSACAPKASDGGQVLVAGGERLTDEEKNIAVGLLFFEPSCENPAERAIYLCGGTRVSEKHIVTAAHCVQFERTKVDKVLVFKDINKLISVLPQRNLECRPQAGFLPGGGKFTAQDVVEATRFEVAANLANADHTRWHTVDDIAVVEASGLTQTIVPIEGLSPNSSTQFEVYGPGTQDCVLRHQGQTWFDYDTAGRYGLGKAILKRIDHGTFEQEMRFYVQELAREEAEIAKQDGTTPPPAPTFAGLFPNTAQRLLTLNERGFLCKEDSGSGVFQKVQGRRSLVAVQSSSFPTSRPNAGGQANVGTVVTSPSVCSFFQRFGLACPGSAASSSSSSSPARQTQP